MAITCLRKQLRAERIKPTFLLFIFLDVQTYHYIVIFLFLFIFLKDLLLNIDPILDRTLENLAVEEAMDMSLRQTTGWWLVHLICLIKLGS
jgi:hypothetical protein